MCIVTRFVNWLKIWQVMSITEDLNRGGSACSSTSSKSGTEGLLQILNGRDVRVVPFSGWEKIDTEERRLGSLRGKPREKLSSWNELLSVAVN